VHHPQGSQLVRLVEDGRDRRADAGGGGAQGILRIERRAVIRINSALYQWPLMLGRPIGSVKPPALLIDFGLIDAPSGP